MSIADTGRFWEILVIPVLQILEDSGKILVIPVLCTILVIPVLWPAASYYPIVFPLLAPKSI